MHTFNLIEVPEPVSELMCANAIDIAILKKRSQLPSRASSDPGISALVEFHSFPLALCESAA